MFFEQSKGNSKKLRTKVNLIAPERQGIPFELMTVPQIQSCVGREMTFDCEIYRNYSLVVFMDVLTKRFLYLEMTTGEQLDTELISYMMYQICSIGFNSNKYDLIIVSAMIHGFDCNTLKEISDDIIKKNRVDKDGEVKFELRENDILEKWNFKLIRKINTYDLYEVAPLDDSLKKYAARMHAKRLQELPYPEDAILTLDQRIKTREYCFVDNQNTDLLRNELVEQIELRRNVGKMYGGIDLRSKSDAQMAEAVFISELTKLNGRRPYKPEYNLDRVFTYTPPAFIHFQTPELQAILEKVKACRFSLRANGSPRCDELAGNKDLGIPALTAQINGRGYTMGLGGLHSTEHRQTIVAAPGWGLFDTDFASFYPLLILNNEWFPAHLGRGFLIIFAKIVNDRLSAKEKATLAKALANKDDEAAWKVIADSLKITINGSFGKFGSVFSLLFSPDLLIQTTVTGQLILLMLIEACELAAIRVVSANTDGFVVYLQESQRELFDRIVKGFEGLSNLKTEETAYKALYSRDVNSYIAVKTDGEVKVKGEYSEKGSTGNTRLSKNPEGLIIADAVVAYLTKGTPIVQTIRECRDVRRFLLVKNVKGGGHQAGRYLGKTVRWVYGKGVRETINYVDSGNTVGGSYGAFPLMDLPDEFPDNIDHDRYIAYALSALVDIGYVKETLF